MDWCEPLLRSHDLTFAPQKSLWSGTSPTYIFHLLLAAFVDVWNRNLLHTCHWDTKVPSLIPSSLTILNLKEMLCLVQRLLPHRVDEVILAYKCISLHPP